MHLGLAFWAYFTRSLCTLKFNPHTTYIFSLQVPPPRLSPILLTNPAAIPTPIPHSPTSPPSPPPHAPSATPPAPATPTPAATTGSPPSPPSPTPPSCKPTTLPTAATSSAPRSPHARGWWTPNSLSSRDYRRRCRGRPMIPCLAWLLA